MRRVGALPAVCLAAAVEPVGGSAIVGHASLCVVEARTRGTFDLEHLEPAGKYVEWLAYFDRPWACSMASIVFQLRGFGRPCTLSDLDGPDPPGALQRVGNLVVGANGAVHADWFVRQTAAAARAQMWLLVGRASSTSRVQSPTHQQGDGDVYEGRAIFDLP